MVAYAADDRSPGYQLQIVLFHDKLVRCFVKGSLWNFLPAFFSFRQALIILINKSRGKPFFSDCVAKALFVTNITADAVLERQQFFPPPLLCLTKSGHRVSFSRRQTAVQASLSEQDPELGTWGIFDFFNNKKIIFCLFYQVNLTGSGLLK